MQYSVVNLAQYSTLQHSAGQSNVIPNKAEKAMSQIKHPFSKRKFCSFPYIIAIKHQNSPTVEFGQEKIDGILRRANTEPSGDFRRANTEPSVDLRTANTELSVYFRRANTET